MNVSEAAAELNVSARRVRALIESGRIAAHKVGGSWEISDLGGAPRRRRPLSERSRDMLATALHRRTLQNLTGHDRARTATRIRELRTAADPARLLVDWWGGDVPIAIGFGYNLVQHATEGNNGYVYAALHRRQREYLRRAEALADVIASERTIQGLTRQQLASAAAVAPASVSDAERAQPLTSPAAVRRILRALDIEPSALPDISVGPAADARRGVTAT